MTTPDIERLEQHLAANPRLRQEFVFGSMVGGMARMNRNMIEIRLEPQPVDLAAFAEAVTAPLDSTGSQP